MTNDTLKERVPHGNALFPLELHEFQTDILLKERVCCHWHEELEFLVVTNGEGFFHIDNRIYHIRKGDLVFVNSDHLHSITGINDLPLDFFAVVFSPILLTSYANDAIQQKYIDPVLSGRKPFKEYISPAQDWEFEAVRLLNKIRDVIISKKTAFELQIKILLYSVWNIFYLNSPDSSEVAVINNDYRIKRIKLILCYIHENFQQEISIAELSGAFNMSEGQLCRFFKSMVKMSVINYINYYRINESAKMLEQTDKPIGEIACGVGFNNISYYNRIFRRYMHCSPTEFRLRLKSC